MLKVHVALLSVHYFEEDQLVIARFSRQSCFFEHHPNTGNFNLIGPNKKSARGI